MNPIATLRRHFANVERSRQLLEEIREGIANLTDVTNRHLANLVEIMELAVEEANQEMPRAESRSIPSASVPQRTPFPHVVPAESADH